MGVILSVKLYLLSDTGIKVPLCGISSSADDGEGFATAVATYFGTPQSKQNSPERTLDSATFVLARLLFLRSVTFYAPLLFCFISTVFLDTKVGAKCYATSCDDSIFYLSTSLHYFSQRFSFVETLTHCSKIERFWLSAVYYCLLLAKL